MKFADMQPLSNPNMTESSSAGRIQFIKMNVEGVTTRVRLLGNPYRRYFHFIDVEKPDGTKQRKSVCCSNYDYESADLAVKPTSEWDCILDEVYDNQINKGGDSQFSQPHKDLPFVSFPELPEAFRRDNRGNDKPPQRVTFQANFLAINRSDQETEPTNCIQLASFKKMAWGRVYSIATGANDGGVPNPDFAKGDPADVEKGYDLAIVYRRNVAPSEMYTVSAANNISPLKDDEKQLISDFEVDFKIEEYFKIRTREETIEYLTNVREADGFPHGANKSTSDIIEAELQTAASKNPLDLETKVGSTPF